MERRGFVMQVSQRERLAASDVCRRRPDEHAIHRDAVACIQVARGKFVLRGDIRHEPIVLAAERELFALPQIGERNQNVVAGVELEKFLQVTSDVVKNGAPCESRLLL